MAVSNIPAVASGLKTFTSTTAATIISGGYFEAGNLLIVNVHFKTNGSGAGLLGMPVIKNAPMPVLLYDWAADTAKVGYVNAGGTIVVPTALGSGREYLAMGVFVKN